VSEHYRIVEDDGLSDERGFCAHCGHGKMWTIESGFLGEEIAIGTSWGDQELAQDVCELMNDAYDAGREADPAVNVEEAKLVAWFRNEGKRLGDEGDYNNWTPAETAIHAMRRLLK
jgi:hypothetical protein